MKILVIDKSSFYYDRILDVYLEEPCFGIKELVWKITNNGIKLSKGYGQFFLQEELIENKTYIDLDKHPDIKTFI